MIFFRIAWMEKYKGLTKHDKPIGGGKFVKEHNDGGEVKNFLPRNGRVYGFVRVKDGQSIHIEKLGVAKKEEKVENVTVVFFAPNPYSRKSVIVGWYKNATVLRHHNNREQHAFTIEKHACLIPISARNMEMPKEGPGQSNVWYGSPAFIKKIDKYIREFSLNKKTNRFSENKKTKIGNWQADAALRQKVEHAAMKAVEKYYIELGSDKIEYVYREKVGWDMVAYFGLKKYLIEVKGLQHDQINVELTHNEYTQANTRGKEFVLCVVTNAINTKKCKVHEFQYQKADEIWISRDGIQLQTQVLTSARLFKI